MARVQYARFHTKHAPMNEDFAYQLAERYFGAEALADLPRYVRGPKKGQIKAWLGWYHVDVGGWGNGMVLKPGVARAWITGSWAGTEDTALRGMWCGRIQSLCGSKSVLTAEYREQEIAQRERTRLENEELYANHLATRALLKEHDPEGYARCFNHLEG